MDSALGTLSRTGDDGEGETAWPATSVVTTGICPACALSAGILAVRDSTEESAEQSVGVLASFMASFLERAKKRPGCG